MMIIVRYPKNNTNKIIILLEINNLRTRLIQINNKLYQIQNKILVEITYIQVWLLKIQQPVIINLQEIIII